MHLQKAGVWLVDDSGKGFHIREKGEKAMGFQEQSPPLMCYQQLKLKKRLN